MVHKAAFLLLMVFKLTPAWAKSLQEAQIDLQSHLGAHIPLPFLFNSPEDNPDEIKSHNHRFEQTMYTQHLLESNIDIWGMAAYPMYTNHKNSILKQLHFFKKFAQDNADYFEVAYKPEDLKNILAKNKRAIFLSIEGADKIIHSKDDVKMWKAQGVSLITPIHLNDNEFGSAWVGKGFQGLLNPGGSWRLKVHSSDPGLTKLGKQAMQWLIDEEIMVDLSHMSPQSVIDTLDIFKKNKAKPIMTHGHLFHSLRTNVGIKDEQIVTLYDLGGMLGLAMNMDSVDPVKSLRPKKYCPGSIDGLVFNYRHVQQLISQNSNLSDFGIAISGDWNGFVNHLRPKFGPLGCDPATPAPSDNPYHVQGMIHPGLFPGLLKALAEEVKMNPINSAASHFYRIWSSYKK